MLITDDKYKVLAKRIGAGDFLKNDAPVEDGLPSLPVGADADIKSFYGDCKATLALYQKKLDAMSKKMEAALEAAKVKELACISSDLTNDFNEKLQAEYEKQKATSEETISNLRNSLNESTKISSDALSRSKKLAEENEILKAEIKKFKFPKTDVRKFTLDLSTIYEVKVRNLDENVSMDTKISKAKSELAEKIFCEGVDFVSNIKVVKNGEEINVCMMMLKKMMNATKGFLDKDTLNFVGNAMLKIWDKRSAAMEEQEDAPRTIVNNLHGHSRIFGKVENYNIDGGQKNE